LGDASSTLEGQAAAVDWTDLIHESQVHCLAGLLGSTSHVGIVGYTMGAGFGWLGCKYGDRGRSRRRERAGRER
jgi:dienelactone hydrolase